MASRSTSPDYALLMSGTRRTQLTEQKGRTASLNSNRSGVSVASSDVSQFLEDKINYLQSDVEYHKIYLAGLREIQETGTRSSQEMQDARDQTLDVIKPIAKELSILKRSLRGLTEDVEDEVASSKRARVDDEPPIGLVEKAYTSSLVRRVMAASAKQPKSEFSKRDQNEFRRKVLEYYNAVQGHDPAQGAYCHLTGWFDASQIRAAHIVPKSLTNDELTYLFGSDENAAMRDVRNGLSLHKKVEEALDSGNIVIVPVPDTENQVTRWRCILVNETLRKQQCFFTKLDQSAVIWDDLDNREIEFLSENRPARRFLYFRFIITYLNAKRLGHADFTKNVEAKRTFWASPGEYLRRSTLRIVARNISGLELPPSLYNDTTFDDLGGKAAAEAEDIAWDTTMHLREAVTSSRRPATTDDTTDDDTEEDEP